MCIKIQARDECNSMSVMGPKGVCFTPNERDWHVCSGQFLLSETIYRFVKGLTSGNLN